MRALATRRDIAFVGFIGILVGALLATVLVVSMPAGAADGDTMTVGRKNYGNKVTQIKGKGGVKFWNTTKTGEPAAWFEVVSGPPIAVNSNTKVANLNADYLDNWHISSIAPRIATAGPAPKGTICSGADCASNVLALTIDAPHKGILLIGGHLDLERYVNSDDVVICGFRVDGSWILSGTMGRTQVQVGNNASGAYNQEDDCCLTATALVEAGEHTVTLRVESIRDADTKIGIGGNLWATWYPIDASTGGFFANTDGGDAPAEQ